MAAATEPIGMVGGIGNALEVEVEISTPLKGPRHRLEGGYFLRNEVTRQEEESTYREGAPPNDVSGRVEVF